MGATLWHFVERADGEMVRLPAVRARKFLAGRGRLETGGREELRFLDVMLDVDRRVVRQFVAAWPIRRRVTADGAQDPDHVRDAMRAAVASADLLSVVDDRDENVVGIGPHIARRDTATVHRWAPSSEQLQQVLNVIHRAAVDPPVAIVSADGRLLPV
jgi:hypothetical protein